MGAHKRKAEGQLERTTFNGGPCQKANPPKNMISLITSFFCNLFKPLNDLESSTASTALYSKSLKAGHNLHPNENVSQNLPTKSLPAEAVNPKITNNSGSDGIIENRIVDTSGFDKNQARHIIDQYWEPKPLPWKKNPPRVDRQYSTSEAKSDQKTDMVQKFTSTTLPYPTRISNGHELHSKPPLLERNPINNHRSLGTPQSWKNLEDSLNNLFLGDSEQLTLSRFKTEKNRLHAEERKEKIRQASIQEARQRRLGRKLPQKNLVQILHPHWENRVNKAHLTRTNDALTTSIGGTELRIKDFRTLLDLKSWLNDEVINAYIEWIVEAANKAANEEAATLGLPQSRTPRFIAHNSFFYQSLSKKGPESQDRLMKKKGAPGLSLLEVDSVFVPICYNSHWTLGVVRPIAKTIEYFDSMGGNPTKFISLMQDWLKHQLGGAYISGEWKCPETLCANQTNGYDCGVFVCTNAFCVAVGLDTSCYEERDMRLQRRNIAAILLNRGFKGDFAWQVQENGLFY